MAGVGNDGAVFHHFEVFSRKHVFIACNRAEDIANLRCFVHGHHAEAIHHGFERLCRINFRDDHFRPGAPRAAGQPASAPAVAGNYELRSGQQKVGRANDAVNRRLPGAVTIVEKVLGIGVVHRNNRIPQHAFFGHRPQADHASGRLLRAAQHAIEHVLALSVKNAH